MIYCRKTLAAALSALLCITASVSSCQTEELAEPKLVITQASVEVPASGGDASVTYTLENAITGEKFRISSDDEWVDRFNQDEPGVISFTVSPNDAAEERSTNVVVQYGSATAGFVVIQAAADPDAPVFTVNETEVRMTCNGGTAKVTYTIENPVDGETLEASCQEDWISGIDTSVDGEVSFSIAANQSDERTASLKLTYAGITRTVDVIQEAQAAPFEVDVENITETSADIVVTPLDPQMSYLPMVIEKEEADKFATDEELFKSIVDNFTKVAGNYGLSLEEFLMETQALSVGKSTANITMLKVSREHIAIAVGMDYEGNMLTGIVRENFRTLDVVMIDITFEISYVVDGPDVEMSVTPSINDQLYYFNALPADKVDSYGKPLEEVMQDFLDEQISFGAIFGNSPEAVINNLSSKGPVKEMLTGMIAAKEYVGFAFSVKESGVINSAMARKNFTTGLAEPSDNQIYVRIPVVSLTEASYSVTTTNDDPYVFIITPAAGLEGLSGEEILEEVINSGKYDISRSVFNGNYSGVAQGLSPETKYYALAFGYYAGMATTGLTKVEFSTYGDTGSDFAELAIDVTDISGGKVYFTVTGTPETAAFLCGVTTADADAEAVIAEMKATVDQLISQGSIDSMATYFRYNAKKGSYSTNRGIPGDQFKVYAYGVDIASGEYDADVTFTEVLSAQ